MKISPQQTADLKIPTALAPEALFQVEAWGIAPGFRLRARDHALKARFNPVDDFFPSKQTCRGHESRFQRCGLLGSMPPAALPQASSDVAPLALSR